jgi:hypothetical protein
MPAGYKVSFYRQRTDERLAAYVSMPTLPFTGMRLTLPGAPLEVHEVTAVQVFPFQPGSWEDETGQPLYADAIVVHSVGVHAAHQEAEEQ